MREIVDIIENVVSSLSFTTEIKTVTDNGNGTYTLGVCCTYHVQPFCTVSINGIDYRVTDIVNDSSITIESNTPPLVGELVNISAPKYFHGTRPATNEELSEITDVSDKLPFVYLFEVINESFSNDEENRIERESNLRLFFLGSANFSNWYTDDHYKYAIVPMRNLVFKFIEAINTDMATFADFDNYNLINHVKFGVFTDNNGHTNRFFNEDLSGVEMRVTLPVLKDIACSDACDC
tara:strand:- start:106 stop:813 length:708 start_codon:yes stop_codon:yes gene_type:complete